MMRSSLVSIVLCLAALPAAAIRGEQTSALTALADRKECTLPEVDGYERHCGYRCRSRTISKILKGSKELEERTASCGEACDAAEKCNCFVVTAEGRCRLGLSASGDVKQSTKSTEAAYVSSRVNAPTQAQVLSFTDDADSSQPCQRGQFATHTGQCSRYFQCVNHQWSTHSCPFGLAFSPQSLSCEWAEAVPGCAPEAQLDEVGCGKGRSFLLAKGDEMQAMIRHEMDKWTYEVEKHPEIRLRAEGVAAKQILQSVSIDVAGDTTERPSRWAVFSRNEDGTVVMQAVALVGKQENIVDIMAIVSRRSLLKDAVSKGGAGKALLGGILEVLRKDEPSKAIVVQGTPGDKFVEALYLKHGMVEVGRSEESGMPKLELSIDANCVPFMKSAILCSDANLGDYIQVAWRLMPFSEKLRETCAHIMPRDLYLEQLRKVLKFAS